MNNFRFIVGELRQGKSLARALFNTELSRLRITGAVLDVGGGKHRDYLAIMDTGGVTSMQSADLIAEGSGAHRVDFETDQLPFPDGTFDTVLAFNIFEHIFNYTHLVAETRRVLKPGGRLIGFVPFLVNYHPDPHDYFRYTKESLKEILTRAGFSEVVIREVGRGPFAVNYNNLMLSLPRIVRLIAFPFWYALDALYLLLRPNITSRYPLGYLFFAKA